MFDFQKLAQDAVKGLPEAPSGEPLTPQDRAERGKAKADAVWNNMGEPVPVPYKALTLLLQMAAIAAVSAPQVVGAAEACVLAKGTALLPGGPDKLATVGMVEETLKLVSMYRAVERNGGTAGAA